MRVSRLCFRLTTAREAALRLRRPHTYAVSDPFQLSYMRLFYHACFRGSGDRKRLQDQSESFIDAYSRQQQLNGQHVHYTCLLAHTHMVQINQNLDYW